MNRRQFLAQATIASALAGVSFAKAEKSTKKGFCGMKQEQAKLLEAVWTYNWGSTGKSEAVLGLLRRGASLVADDLVRLRNIENRELIATSPELFEGVTKMAQEKKANYVLGFNEPERKSQGDLTVAAAIELWPKLEAIGLPLGSPAPSSDGGGMKWLDEFMAEAKKKKLRIDFLALHWYRSSNSGDFEGWLKEMNRKYRLPIWITEFNAGGGDARVHERFLKDVVKSMDRLKFVDRYAYFTPGADKPGGLFKSDGSLSELGEFYRSV